MEKRLVLGLDPGPTQSAIVSFNGSPVDTKLQENDHILGYLIGIRETLGDSRPTLVIEKIESQGMAVGAETFETVYWSGRFAQAYGTEKVERIGRKKIKLHLCDSVRATDANIRCVLLDRFGGKEAAVGKKHTPGPLYAIKSHLWAALAVAVAFYELRYDNPTADAVEAVKRGPLARPAHGRP